MMQLWDGKSNGKNFNWSPADSFLCRSLPAVLQNLIIDCGLRTAKNVTNCNFDSNHDQHHQTGFKKITFEIFNETITSSRLLERIKNFELFWDYD